MNTPKKNISSNRLMLLITIVSHKKAEFYADFIQSLGANVQFSTFGEGTAEASTLDLMGLTDNEKAILFSVIREEQQESILRSLQKKFELIKNGKGVAFTVPFSSVIGASVYHFLSDNRILFK